MVFRQILLLLACALLCACGGADKRADRVCGVPVGGTPWEFAAAVHDRGDRTFVPESVVLIGQTKAYIVGWTLPSEQPDTIFCDLIDGKVVAAHLFTVE